ncbi:histone-lysine N-methyltransferase SETMAR [Plakobranchus ocellatus]|uniref:Histone-lysine N-methyltransferase SETMAR n=1 Tax=Plakobranchus ocellatus TaxID=259542 RepID=A0AAV3YDN4_9GAST|nr:histone-lysine N-methyltransferase SETMAR [Plakobranchus ocellatus]
MFHSEETGLLDRHLTVKRVSGGTGISIESTEIIYHDHLGINKMSARQMTRSLTSQQKKFSKVGPTLSPSIGEPGVGSRLFLAYSSMSPDLAPSDFHLFGPLKRHLGSLAFETEDDLISELRNWFDNLDVDFFRTGVEGQHKTPFRALWSTSEAVKHRLSQVSLYSMPFDRADMGQARAH